MNAALRILAASGFILTRAGEILNAVFICRPRKEDWGAAPAPQTPGAY
jgi:hypothetical protein